MGILRSMVQLTNNGGGGNYVVNGTIAFVDSEGTIIETIPKIWPPEYLLNKKYTFILKK